MGLIEVGGRVGVEKDRKIHAAAGEVGSGRGKSKPTREQLEQEGKERGGRKEEKLGKDRIKAVKKGKGAKQKTVASIAYSPPITSLYRARTTAPHGRVEHASTGCPRPRGANQLLTTLGGSESVMRTGQSRVLNFNASSGI